MGDLTKNFSRSEFASHYEGITTPVPAQYDPNLTNLAINLQYLRDKIGKPIVISSGYRTLAHNLGVGGVLDSRHMIAQGADIFVNGMSTSDLYCAIEGLVTQDIMRKGGLGLYLGHVHYDIRLRPSRWAEDVRVPLCPEPEPEPVPVPKPEEEEEEDTVVILHGDENPGSYYLSSNWVTRRHLGSTEELNWYRYLGVKEALIPQKRLDEIIEIQEG